MDKDHMHLSIVLIGASGDLAQRKILPVLFALSCQGFLPDDFHVFGFARSALGRDTFRSSISEHLNCHYGPCPYCGQRMEQFLERCCYIRGHYDNPEDFVRLRGQIEEKEGGIVGNRMFYLAVPPSVFLDAARSIGAAQMVQSKDDAPWSRVVIEKPFGEDRASSDMLVRELGSVFREEQIYRIDHYLGKEVIQNLMVLRFANLIFEPVWCNLFIDHVRIAWTEDAGVGSRAGYFDRYGIIRDVMQNHLLQILALLTMEEPADLRYRVRDEKVKLLRCVEPVRLDRMVLGQYTPGRLNGSVHPGYREEARIPGDSKTPTFGAAVMHIHNRRWEGVPFLMCAGKGMDVRHTEIRVRFKSVPGNIFCNRNVCLPPNELVIRVQPDEAVYLKIVNKHPGLSYRLAQSRLDLRYAAAFDEVIPDAYESLLMDVLKGERSLFIREDELQASWDIFDPVLHAIEERGIEPEPYAFGAEGPAAAQQLAAGFGIDWCRGEEGDEHLEIPAV
jgi:glucose-6-phosphate 1-dehydrogenase